MVESREKLSRGNGRYVYSPVFASLLALGSVERVVVGRCVDNLELNGAVSQSREVDGARR